jgi:hypothetical protein
MNNFWNDKIFYVFYEKILNFVLLNGRIIIEI